MAVVDCGPPDPPIPAPRMIDERIRELMWGKLPERGFIAQEMRCLRRFLEEKGLWGEYLDWVRQGEP
jgi:hypothetical protein